MIDQKQSTNTLQTKTHLEQQARIADWRKGFLDTDHAHVCNATVRRLFCYRCGQEIDYVDSSASKS